MPFSGLFKWPWIGATWSLARSCACNGLGSQLRKLPTLWTNADRLRRRYSAVREDQRTEFERDRDRILYTSAFRRLSGITQIVRAGEADVFHTRQQHTIKVAQVGRRLAQ